MAQPQLQIEGRAGGMMMTVSYWLTDSATGRWALVDPTYEAEETWADRLGGASPPDAIFITHGHIDHVAGLAAILRRFPAAPVWVHPKGKEMIEDAGRNGAALFGLPFEPARATMFYREGDEVAVGESRLRVIESEGHCPGSVMLLAGGELIAGDVLFQGSVGRWDLPGADYDTLARTMREKVMTLPDGTRIYPGHGNPTTVGEERRTNYIVRKMLAGERVD